MSDTDMLYMASLQKRLADIEAENTELKARIAELEDKHWNECRQIAHYDDELKTSDRLLGKAMSQCVDLDTEAWKHTAEKIELKVLLGEIRPVLKRAYFADPDDTKLANVLYDKINELIGRE